MDRREFIPAIIASFSGLAGETHDYELRRTRTLNASNDSWIDRIRNPNISLFLDISAYGVNRSHESRAEAYLEEMSSQPGTPSVILGFHGNGLAHALCPEAWTDLRVAERISQGPTEAGKNKAEVAIWLERMKVRFDDQVILLACGRTLGRWQENVQLDALGAHKPDWSQMLIAGTYLVPAMVTASARVQHIGAAYMISNA